MKHILRISVLLVALTLTLGTTKATETTVKAEEINGSQPQRELKQAGMTTEELNLLYLVCMCEAGNQPTEGIRAVCATILNRVEDKGRFGKQNTISKVVYAKNQFSCVWDGAFKRWTPTEEVKDAVDAELESRSINSLFFKTKGYHKGTTPIKKIGDHYFSR